MHSFVRSFYSMRCRHCGRPDALIRLLVATSILALGVFEGSVRAQEPLASTGRGWVEIEMSEGGQSLRITERQACWLLGKTLATGMVLELRGMEVGDSYDSVEVLAKSLQINLPERPKLEQISDIFPARRYLMQQEKSVSRLIAAKHSADCSGVFELSAELLMAGLLYYHETDANDVQVQLNELVRKRLIATFKMAQFSDADRSQAILKPLLSKVEASEELKPKVLVSALDGFADLLAAEAEDLRKQDSSMVAETKRQPSGEQIPSNVEQQEAQRLVEKFLGAGERESRSLTLSLQPSMDACKKLLGPDVAVAAFQAYDELYQDDSMVIAPSPRYEEVKLRSISTDALISKAPIAREFPGGYADVAKFLRPGFRLYQFSFVERGQDSGLRFDGLVKIDGKWFLFPKMWRFVKPAREAGEGTAPAPVEPKPEPPTPPDSSPNMQERSSEAPLDATTAQARLAELRSASESAPDDVAARARYAQALFLIGNTPEAWKQLNLAFLQKTNHSGIQAGLADVMKDFEQRGILEVGVPSSVIIGILGEPREIAELGRGLVRRVYGIHALYFLNDKLHRIADLRTDLGNLGPATEKVQLLIDEQVWKCRIRKVSTAVEQESYLLRSEIGEEERTEELEMYRLPDDKTLTLNELVEQVVLHNQSRSESTRWEILSSSEDSAIFRVTTPRTGGVIESSLGKVFRGKTDFHLVVYKKRGSGLPEAEQQLWLQRLQRAELKPIRR